jgi:hypothetical protein
MSTFAKNARRATKAVATVLATAALIVSGLIVSGMSLASTAYADPRHSRRPSAGADFGPNVKIFDPSMPRSQIQSQIQSQATVDAIAAQQVDNEMGTARCALLFKPGVYGTADSPRTTASRSTTSGARCRTSPST